MLLSLIRTIYKIIPNRIYLTHSIYRFIDWFTGNMLFVMFTNDIGNAHLFWLVG